MSRFVSILRLPYPYYIPFSRSIKLVIFFSVIVPVFLILFEPFGLSRSNCQYLTTTLAGMSLPIFLTLSLNFYGLARLLPTIFNEHSWTIGKEGVWSLWNFLTVVGSTSIYWLLIPVCGSSSIEWTEQLSRGFLIGLVPGLSCIYFNYSHELKKKLKRAQNLNSHLQAKISYYEHGKLTLVSENETEAVNLNTDTLVLIQSYDNYSKIILEDEGKTTVQLIRSSLKQIDKQIDYPFIIRCHRSYIINVAKIEEVFGNARDFKLKLKHHEEWIPVSREAYKKMKRLFTEYSPMTKSPVVSSLSKKEYASEGTNP